MQRVYTDVFWNYTSHSVVNSTCTLLAVGRSHKSHLFVPPSSLEFLECNINMDLLFSEDWHFHLHRWHLCLIQWSTVTLVWHQCWVNSSTSTDMWLVRWYIWIAQVHDTCRILIPEPVAVCILYRIMVLHNNHSHAPMRASNSFTKRWQ